MRLLLSAQVIEVMLPRRAVLGVGVFLFLALSCSTVNANWSEVSQGAAGLLRGISFVNSTTGFAVGFQGVKTGSALLMSNDSGASWNNPESVNDGATYLYNSVEVARDALTGIAAGVGLIETSGISVTSDGGLTWNKTRHLQLEAFFVDAGVARRSAGQALFAVGQWIKLRDIKGEGVALSVDSGRTFRLYDWQVPEMRARYGSFVNHNYGLITGGKFPRLLFSVFLGNGHVEQMYIDQSDQKLHQLSSRIALYDNKLALAPSDLNAVGDKQYSGIITRTDDRARSFHVMHNTSMVDQNLAFNGISCVDVNHCWVVSEGYNTTSEKQAGWIHYTPNGGITWIEQLYQEHVSFVRIRMLNASVGWAIGGEVPTITLVTGCFYKTTDGGNTWKKETQRAFVPFDISVVDEDTAFATGTTLELKSTILQYSS